MTGRKKRRKFLGIDVMGHLEALGVGFKYLFQPRATVKYPEVFQEFSPNYRGMIKLDMKVCISCTQCARICPSNAIKMYKVGERKYPGLTYERCIFCGFCIDICPVDALSMGQVHDKAYYNTKKQVFTPEQLSEAPSIEEKVIKVKPKFDVKRGLRYEHS